MIVMSKQTWSGERDNCCDFYVTVLLGFSKKYYNSVKSRRNLRFKIWVFGRRFEEWMKAQEIGL